VNFEHFILFLFQMSVGNADPFSWNEGGPPVMKRTNKTHLYRFSYCFLFFQEEVFVSETKNNRGMRSFRNEQKLILCEFRFTSHFSPPVWVQRKSMDLWT
jgi:hypothetical protein